MVTKPAAAPLAVQGMIVSLRGQRVLLSQDLSALYGVETKVLMQAVQRNRSRFPDDFMFQLTADELSRLKSQIVTSNVQASDDAAVGKGFLKSQVVTSKGRGGVRKLPHAFTEQGVAMLSSVLRSPQAVAVNIEIMRAFVRHRVMLQTNTELAKKLAVLEAKTDAKFKAVFDAIYKIMEPEDTRKKKRIGFLP